MRQSQWQARWWSGFIPAGCLLAVFCGLQQASAQQASQPAASNTNQSLFRLNATKFANENFSNLTDMGVKAYLSRDYSEAEQLFITALDKARQQNLNDGRMSTLLTNLGSVYRQEHRYAEAEQAFKDALTVAKSNMAADRAPLNYVVKQYGALLRKTDRPFEAGLLEESARNGFRVVPSLASADTPPIERDPFFARASGENLAFLSRRFEWTADMAAPSRYRPRYHGEVDMEDIPLVAAEPPGMGIPDVRAVLPGVVPVPCACHQVGQVPPQMIPDYQIMEWIRLRRQQAMMLRQAGMMPRPPHHGGGRSRCGRGFH